MRLSQRLIAAAVLVALSAALAGCSSSLGSWDPSDLLDFFDTKKKLPGERKEVFPDGVPGLEQGVPKDLYKGAVEQQQLDQQNAEAAAAAAPPPEEPKTKKSKCQEQAAGDGKHGASRCAGSQARRPRKRAAPPPCRPRPSPRKRLISAPPRRRRIRTPRNRPRRRPSPVNRRSNQLSHSRRRCRAAASPARLCLH